MKELLRIVALDESMANLAGRRRNSPRYSILKRGEDNYPVCLMVSIGLPGLSRAVFHS